VSQPVLEMLMSLLLSTAPREPAVKDQTNISMSGLGSWPQKTPAAAGSRAREKERVRTAIFERTYRQIMDARLGHLPTKLPFPRSAIMNRLKENDRLADNWTERETLLEIETELAFLHGSLSSHEGDMASIERPRTRRLKTIWDFLSLSAKRLENLRLQRVGRLNFSATLFFRSDLPPSYLVDVGEATQWETAALTISANAETERLVQRLCGLSAAEVSKEDFLQSDCSLHDIEKAYREYTRRLRRATTVSDRVLEWRDALEYYVDLFSTDDLASFRTSRDISITSLNIQVLNYLTTGLHGAVQDLRGILAGEYAEELSAFSWRPMDDDLVTDLVSLELESV